MLFEFSSLNVKESKKWSEELPFDYLEKSDFKEFRKEQKQAIEVLRYIYLRTVDEDDIDSNENYIQYKVDDGDYEYEYNFLIRYVKKEKKLRWKRVAGYAHLITGEWVAICEHFVFLPFLLLLFLLLLFGGIVLGRTLIPKHDLDFEGTEITEEAKTPTIVDYTEIPGFFDVVINESHPSIRLINPKSNTVYFVYTLLCDDEEVFATKAIAPGLMVDADLLNVLSKGTHNLTIEISTYDIETEAVCNGSKQTIIVTVE